MLKLIMKKEIKKLQFYFKILFQDDSLELLENMSLINIICGCLSLCMYHNTLLISFLLTGIVIFLATKFFIFYAESVLYVAIYRLITKYHIDEELLKNHIEVDYEMKCLYSKIRQKIAVNYHRP